MERLKAVKPLAGAALAALILLTAAQGFYACHLNALFYQRYGPFFDSMAYTNQLADILTIAKEQGITAGLKAAIHGGTVSFPWITVSLFSPILSYSRFVGIWMQEFWMAVLAISVFVYLYRFRGAPGDLGGSLDYPLFSLLPVYRYNGGISDFRMDLFLYIFLSLTAIWYLAALETDLLLPWVLSGVFLCLSIRTGQLRQSTLL